MTGSEIREKYIEFFKERGHVAVKSDLLVPANDPTLLFTGAGMNQFKDQFMGRNIEFSRAVSCQKCLRTGDLENVGRTPRHHTFFEMLGNFSFGDYFKKDAIRWAWEFMTECMGFKEEDLWVSVYRDDKEAYEIWKNEIKIHAEKIVKLGPKDNFWPSDAPGKGPNGPCGPCSEIFFDWGEETGCKKKGCDPSCDCGRFVEIWNLVFTEFERKSDGTLAPLPDKNIDTGMGLERITSIKQKVKTNFDTDLFVPVKEEIKNNLAENIPEEPGLNLIADHLRAAVFSIGDGVSPSNEGRGYVVRKLIRRAYLKGYSRGHPFLYKIVPCITGIYKGTYPENDEKSEHISAIIHQEEKRFAETLKVGMPVLEDMITSSRDMLRGEHIFKLVDTYGMPIDVISDKAEDEGLELDLEGFERLMEGRKEQSRQGSVISGDFIFKPDAFENAPVPEGSKEMPVEAEIVFMVQGGKEIRSAQEGEKVELVLSPQPLSFYAEGGGQVGDKGTIEKKGCTVEIVNTYKTGNKLVFMCFVKKGKFDLHDRISVEIDKEKKKHTAMNHTATHLLQAALRNVLGEHIKQSGSYVDEARLRFDFTHMSKVSDRDLAKIEEIVNEWIAKKMEVGKNITTLDEAKKEGALSFFGEKYGDTVRVVSVGGVSKELCGGTHVNNAAEIGLIKITGESSIASGVRRVEAVTGENARNWIKAKAGALIEEYEKNKQIFEKNIDADEGRFVFQAVNDARRICSGEISENKEVLFIFNDKIDPALNKAVNMVSAEKKKLKKSMAQGELEKAKNILDDVIASNIEIGGINFISNIFDDIEPSILKKATSYAGSRAVSGIIILGARNGEKVFINCSVSPDLIDKGISAKKIVDHIAQTVGGGGGGNDSFAQAGGKNSEGLKDAMEAAKKLISENYKS